MQKSRVVKCQMGGTRNSVFTVTPEVEDFGRHQLQSCGRHWLSTLPLIDFVASSLIKTTHQFLQIFRLVSLRVQCK